MPKISSPTLYMLCAILLISICPIPSRDAPDWDVSVTDQAGKPTPLVLVTESYQNYSAELQGHQEEQFTDAQGHVHFAAKWIFAPALVRLGVMAISTLGGVHASFGPYSSITAFAGAERGDDVRQGHLYAWRGSPPKETTHLVLSSHPEPY